MMRSAEEAERRTEGQVEEEEEEEEVDLQETGDGVSV